MNISFFRCFTGAGLFVLGSVFLKGVEPLTVGGVHGGLVVRIGAAETDEVARLSRTGRYVVHVLGENAAVKEKAKPFKKGTQLFNDVHAMALSGNGRLYAVHKD
jgi:hypothetical protein